MTNLGRCDLLNQTASAGRLYRLWSSWEDMMAIRNGFVDMMPGLLLRGVCCVVLVKLGVCELSTSRIGMMMNVLVKTRKKVILQTMREPALYIFIQLILQGLWRGVASRISRSDVLHRGANSGSLSVARWVMRPHFAIPLRLIA